MPRSKIERQAEIRPIVAKLNELHLTPASHESIKLLYKSMQDYILNGERIELNIPFIEYNSTIKGVLTSSKNERVWVKLEHNIP
jgi:hypothetical protein